MNDTDIQWHPGFVAAMELDLMGYELYFESEHNLSRKPLQIDLLIIKKNKPTEITNEIGRVFKKYNIIEYKSPDDSLNIDTLYKVQAYAALYKSDGVTVDEKKIKEITVSLVRERKPLGLFKALEEMDIKIEMPYKGVYYIKDGMMFATQVIVTDELSNDGHIWIKSLSHKMRMVDLKILISKIKKFDNEHERELANSVINVTLRANAALVEELRGDDDMNGLLLELAEPLIKEKEKEAEIRGRQKGRQQGIIGTVDILHSLGHNDEEIKTGIMKSYNLSEEEAEKYL
ncbi:MAG: hypothetical protein HFH68_16465 [Lachnospiraceae bacterium]|nr:hypothetical protein [Lachnospiraceae bacterium]